MNAKSQVELSHVRGPMVDRGNGELLIECHEKEEGTRVSRARIEY